VHLVVPVAAVACDRRTLERLAAVVGRRTGTTRRAGRLEFALAPIGSGLAGPDRATVRNGVWLAPSLARHEAAIVEVLAGRAGIERLG